MASYFKDIRSGVVLRFDLPIDVKALREQVSDYAEVDQEAYERYKDNAKRDITKDKAKK